MTGRPPLRTKRKPPTRCLRQRGAGRKAVRSLFFLVLAHGPKWKEFGFALCKSAPAAHSGHMGLDFVIERAYEYRLISMGLTPEENMAHKKIERKKELARRRHRRAQRLKQRVREAKAAA